VGTKEGLVSRAAIAALDCRLRRNVRISGAGERLGEEAELIYDFSLAAPQLYLYPEIIKKLLCRLTASEVTMRRQTSDIIQLTQ
jgi:hypothetical protein